MRQLPRRGTRPADAASLQHRVGLATSAAVVPSPDGADDGVDRQRLVAEFEHALDEEHNLSAEERDSIVRQYRDALQIAPVDLAPPDIDELRASFLELTGSLAQEQVIASSEREGLIREFNAAIEGLDSVEVQRSTEYARRLGRDGADAAGAWLAAELQDTVLNAPDAPVAEMPFAASLAQAPGSALRARRRR